MDRNEIIGLIKWLEGKQDKERLELLTTLITAFMNTSGKDIPTTEAISQKVLSAPKLLIGDELTEDRGEKEFIFFFNHSLQHLKSQEDKGYTS